MSAPVAVITGGSSGIGKACAAEFGRNGYRIVISGRSASRLEEALKFLENSGITAIACVSDAGSEADCKNLINTAIAKFGRIDILVNNAGMSMRASFLDVDLKVLRQLMDINFWGTVYCTKYALPYLLDSHGSVVGISSIAGKKGLPGRTGYSASKFAMEGFLETLRTETLHKGLHVLVACPGFTATDIRNSALSADGTSQGESPRDEKSMMTADEVAKKIFHAVKKRKRDLILTTEGKLTVWLNKFFPSRMDKIVFNHMRKEPGSPVN